jgi:uncharacterized protein (TIGR00730 family)
MNVLFFCSAYSSDPKYVQDSRKIAELIAKNGHTLVWGGSNVGIMKEIADAAQEAGGKVVGISIERYSDVARKSADEMIVTKDLSERKAVMLSRSDAIVVLPGGLGTLDEATEIIEHKKQGTHVKEIIFLNTAGFYDGFKMQLERMNEEGFLPIHIDKYVKFADTPEEAMRYLE